MLLDKLNSDLKDAMKNKDKIRLDTIRLLKTALKNESIKLEVESLNDEQELNVLAREVKQRKDSISDFKNAGREDLIEKEEAQLKVLESYLPIQLTQDEIEKLVHDTCQELNATSMKDMGKVMGILTPNVKGRADMSFVSKLVKAHLSK